MDHPAKALSHFVYKIINDGPTMFYIMFHVDVK